MKKYLLRAVAGLIAVSLLILAGCDTDNSVNFNTPVIRVVGTIHGVVTDSWNNERMEGVNVVVVQKDKMYETVTDELGYYIVEKLFSGTYEVTFHINGYALSRAYGYIPTEEEIYRTKDDIYYNEVVDHSMFSLTSGLTGKVYKIIDDQVYPASGVTVYADFSHFDIHPDKYSVTTNANGVYTFANLPAAPFVGIMTLPHYDGTYSFDSSNNSANLLPNVTITAQDMGLFITEAPVFVLTHNLQDGFLIGGSIVMTFNKAIVPSSFKVYLGQAKTEINSVTWSNNNTTVTINPDEHLILDTWYELYFEGRSADGNDFDNWVAFMTQPGIEIEKTNLEIYDGHFRITPTKAIIIDFTEAVNTSAAGNYLRIWNTDTWDLYTISGSWSNGNKTLTIPAPTGGYVIGEILIQFGYYSNLAEYDFVSMNREVEVR